MFVTQLVAWVVAQKRVMHPILWPTEWLKRLELLRAHKAFSKNNKNRHILTGIVKRKSGAQKRGSHLP